MLYTTKTEGTPGKRVALDDMFLTKSLPTAAGSRMLEGYKSLFDAEVLSRLTAAGYALAGKTDVGEFAIDLLGETSYNGVQVRDGALRYAACEAILSGEVDAALSLDVNGAPRRGAAQEGLVFLKPTYGTVSRFGTIPAACSGETVGVMAKTAEDCEALFTAILGHDDKDGTSLPEDACEKAKEVRPVRRIAVLTALAKKADQEVTNRLSAFQSALEAMGVEVTAVSDEIFSYARNAWNILMSSEVCNNVSRYDGVKYGYRTQEFTNIDTLYTGSRTEAFGAFLKTVILFGSDNLSTENYSKVYDKALRVRRVIADAFAALFREYDAVLLPAAGKALYTEGDLAKQAISFEENLYTAPASLVGLPSLVVGGVALVGPALSEGSLLALAKKYEGGSK